MTRGTCSICQHPRSESESTANQYQPRLITCAQNDLVVMACLLHGTAHPALGAEDDLEYLAARLRAKWPDVIIEVRGDSGMAVPVMYEGLERLDIQYTLGNRSTGAIRDHRAAIGSLRIGFGLHHDPARLRSRLGLIPEAGKQALRLACLLVLRDGLREQ
jgi:hypothetical protein